MAPQRRDKEIVDNSPLASPSGADITQQSGYEPVREEPSPYSDDFDKSSTGAVKEAEQSASEMGDNAKRQASEVGDKVTEQADEATTKAGGSIENVAGKLREQAEGQSGVTAQAGTKVADTMESTASYLKEHDTQEMLDDLERYVREHPMQALAGAVVGGFLIGRILR